MPIGTVIRITSGRKRKRYLIVVPGNIDTKKRGQIWRAKKGNRVYRIREYPLGVMPGQTVSYEDLDERKGKYWEAEMAGYDPNKESRKEAAPQLTPLEREVAMLPRLPESRRENIVAGLEFLVDDIKRRWVPRGEFDSRTGMYNEHWSNPYPERDPVTNSIQPYVEGKGDDPLTAYTAYRVILSVIEGGGSVHPHWGVDNSDVAMARGRLIQAMSRQIEGKAFERLEAWVKYQRKLVRWDR